MKKVIDFLMHPVVNLVAGLVLYFWVGSWMWQYDSFDKVSALIGSFFVVSVSIWTTGMNGVFDLIRSKSKKEKDIVHGRTYEIDSDQDDSAE